jgi:hypothetical protein
MIVGDAPQAMVGNLTPPGNNHDGYGDWVLILEAN